MILEEIGDILDAQPEFTYGTNLFLGTMPSAPDTCLALYEYSGLDPVFTHGDGLPAMERPRVQVVARAKSYVAARDLIERAFRYVQVTTGDLTILPLQSPFTMGRDDTGVRIGFNTQVHRRYS